MTARCQAARQDQQIRRLALNPAQAARSSPSLHFCILTNIRQSRLTN